MKECAVCLVFELGVALSGLHVDRGRPIIQAIHAFHLVHAALVYAEARGVAVLFLDEIEVRVLIFAHVIYTLLVFLLLL